MLSANHEGLDLVFLKRQVGELKHTGLPLADIAQQVGIVNLGGLLDLLTVVQIIVAVLVGDDLHGHFIAKDTVSLTLGDTPAAQ